MYKPETEDEQRRVFALDQAVRMVAGHGGYSRPEDSVMSAAKTFDTFLKDGVV